MQRIQKRRRTIAPWLLVTALVMSGCAGNPAAESAPADSKAVGAAEVSPEEETSQETQAGAESQPETGAAFGGETVITGGRDAEGTNGVIAAGREDAARIGMDIMNRVIPSPIPTWRTRWNSLQKRERKYSTAGRSRRRL